MAFGGASFPGLSSFKNEWITQNIEQTGLFLQKYNANCVDKADDSSENLYI